MPDQQAPRRVGVMGGTFDPIHHGHLVAASEVQAWFELDEVVFVPTGEPWQKSERKVTTAEHRYLMTVIATASNPRFWVSRVDIDRGGPTYTIDTLRDLHAQRPDADLYFITGADALADIFTWRDAEELFELANFVGCTRPGYEMDPEALARIPAERVTMVEIPISAPKPNSPPSVKRVDALIMTAAASTRAAKRRGAVTDSLTIASVCPVP